MKSHSKPNTKHKNISNSKDAKSESEGLAHSTLQAPAGSVSLSTGSWVKTTS